MKKAEIKRRKRVVPVDAPQYNQNSGPMINDLMDEDASLETESRASVAPSVATSQPSNNRHTNGGPIPVDFTDAFRRQTLLQPQQHDPALPRKRTFSASTRDEDEPYAPTVHLTSRGSENIDPSLSPRESTPHGSRDNKRAELRREAERMREMLLAKEREIAALGEEG